MTHIFFQVAYVKDRNPLERYNVNKVNFFFIIKKKNMYIWSL